MSNDVIKDAIFRDRKFINDPLIFGAEEVPCAYLEEYYMVHNNYSEN